MSKTYGYCQSDNGPLFCPETLKTGVQMTSCSLAFPSEANMSCSAPVSSIAIINGGSSTNEPYLIELILGKARCSMCPSVQSAGIVGKLATDITVNCIVTRE